MNENELKRRLSDLERKVSDMIRIGRVDSIQLSPYFVVVELGTDQDDNKVLSDPLPVLVNRAGDVKTWASLSVGEMVVVLTLGGREGVSFIIPAAYSATTPQPSTDDNLIAISYAGGSFIANKTTGQITIDGDIQVNGSLNARDDLSTEAKGSYNAHTHPYQLPQHPAGEVPTGEPN